VARSERKDAIRSDNAARRNAPPRPVPAPSRAPANSNRHRRNDDMNDGTVGFGDDLPDFMKVVVKV
jgi:hypothetical protein